MEGENENVRQPRNLQGLLRFAMDATQGEDAPENGRNFQQMDPERRQFLESALKALTIDVIEQLQKASQTIGSDSASKDDKLDAIETILNYIDDIDTACDFCKIGGLFVISGCLTSPHTQIRCKVAFLIAELAQNNPYCQKALLEADILPKLMSLLSENETSTDGLRAVSCLVRNYEPAFTAFIEIGGLECLLGCLLQIENEKLIIRTIFFLNSLCNEFPSVQNEFIKLKVVDFIIPIIKPKPEFDIGLETALSALCLFTENDEAASRCQSSEFNFKSKLEEIIKVGGDKPEFKETVEYSQLLLKKLFSSKSDVEATDR